MDANNDGIEDVFDKLAKDCLKTQKEVNDAVVKGNTIEEIKLLFGKESKPIKKVISYKVGLSDSTSWNVKADEIIPTGQLVYFKHKGKDVFIVGTAQLLYINPTEN